MNAHFFSSIFLKEINLIPTILFVFGFSLIFIFFGATATTIGKLLLKNSNELRIVAGIVIIILSLHILKVINIKFLNYEKRVHSEINQGFFAPILIGMAFAFGWTPCIGPMLGSILILASTTESISQGVVLLSFYSLGLGIPFILSGYLIQKFILISKNLKKKNECNRKNWRNFTSFNRIFNYYRSTSNFRILPS